MNKDITLCDSEKLIKLSNKLFILLNSLTYSDRELIKEYKRLISESKEYFKGNTANRFRSLANDALCNFANGSNKGISLYRVAQMPLEFAKEIENDTNKLTRKIQ